MNSNRGHTRIVLIGEAEILIRQALAVAFPRKKFRFRIDRTAYPWDIIHVSWRSAPERRDVDKVLDPFNAEGFDGSNDMLFERFAWLMPDGRVTFAGTDGTRGSRGEVDAAMEMPPSLPAELVSFDLMRIYTHRYEAAMRRKPQQISTMPKDEESGDTEQKGAAKRRN